MIELVNDAIRKINSMIIEQSSQNMTPEQESYVVGLSDALQILESINGDKYTIGNKYYCIMYKDTTNKRNPYIEEMVLYRINKHKKWAYCFTKNYSYPSPDLVLMSDGGLITRVYKDRDKAYQYIKNLN